MVRPLFRSVFFVPFLACSGSPPSEPLESLGGSATALWPEPAEAMGGQGNSGENPWLAASTGSSDGQGSGSPEGEKSAHSSSGSASAGSAGGAGSGAGSAGGTTPNGAGSGAGAEATASGSGPGAGNEPSAGPKILMVRYIESSSADKQLWFENLGRPTEPGECELVIYANGSLEPYRRHALPALAEGGLSRLCTSKVADCEASLGASSFNGNDALVLSCLGAVADSFGRKGEDPGKGWGMAPLNSVDAALVRCSLEADMDPADEVFLGETWAPAPAELSLVEARALCASSGFGGSSGG